MTSGKRGAGLSEGTHPPVGQGLPNDQRRQHQQRTACQDKKCSDRHGACRCNSAGNDDHHAQNRNCQRHRKPVGPALPSGQCGTHPGCQTWICGRQQRGDAVELTALVLRQRHLYLQINAGSTPDTPIMPIRSIRPECIAVPGSGICPSNDGYRWFPRVLRRQLPPGMPRSREVWDFASMASGDLHPPVVSARRTQNLRLGSVAVRDWRCDP